MINKLNFKLVLAILIVLFVFVFNSFFIVNQWNQAIVFQFGEAVRTIKDPGLKVKLPFIQEVRNFDKRILNYNLNAEEIQAQDKKRIIVSAFIKYKIEDVIKFYQSLGNQGEVDSRLHSVLDSSLRQVIGQSPLFHLLSKERGVIMKKIKNIVDEKAKRFGIKVVDLRILRADLPKENSEAIYRRMQSDREMEAREYRAQGVEEADRIKSEAEKESKIIIANANKDSQILKGEGDSLSTKIFNEVYSLDTNFYEFYKSLDVYKNIFNKNDTKIIISPQNDFMKYFNGNKDLGE